MRKPPDASETPARRGCRSPTEPVRRDGVACIPSRGRSPWTPFWANLPSAALRSAAGRFRRRQRGSVAIESALGITILVVSLGVVMEIVSAAYTTDQMSRAARAAARSLALNPPANPGAAATTACNSIIRELDLPAGFVCNTEWTIGIDTDLVPGDLPKTLDPSLGTVARNGDMVFVRIGWDREPFTPGDPPVPMVSLGLARSEP